MMYITVFSLLFYKNSLPWCPLSTGGGHVRMKGMTECGEGEDEEGNRAYRGTVSELP